MSSELPHIEVTRYAVFTKSLAEYWGTPFIVNGVINPMFFCQPTSIGWVIGNELRVEFGAHVSKPINEAIFQLQTGAYTLGQILQLIGYKSFHVLQLDGNGGKTIVTADDFHILLESIPILLIGFQQYERAMNKMSSATGL